MSSWLKKRYEHSQNRWHDFRTMSNTLAKREQISRKSLLPWTWTQLRHITRNDLAPTLHPEDPGFDPFYFGVHWSYWFRAGSNDDSQHRPGGKGVMDSGSGTGLGSSETSVIISRTRSRYTVRNMLNTDEKKETSFEGTCKWLRIRRQYTESRA